MTVKEQTPSNHQVRQSKKSETVSQKTKLPVQKDRQAAKQRKDKMFEEKKEKLQKETQEYMYAQSSKFSSVSRSLIFGIIGTIWVITYTEGQLCIPNFALFISLLSGIVYLVIDVIHYYTDSKSYEDEQNKFDSYKKQEDLEETHENEMNRINERSHSFIKYKLAVLAICAILFFYGLISPH